MMEVSALNELLDTFIKWAIPFLCGSAVTSIVMFLFKFKALFEGVQCLLRDKIIHNHDKYIEKRFCPIYAKESLKRMYKAYHALGGNDVATRLYEELMDLPTELPRDNNRQGAT